MRIPMSFPCAALAVAMTITVPAAVDPQAKAPQAKPAAPQASAPKAAGPARTIEMQGTDNFKFIPNSITAKPGEALRIVLKAVTNMPKMAMAHNFVLLGLKVDVNGFVSDALRAGTTGYIPQARKADIIANTAMAGKGETVEVTFKAPKEKGTYTFVCTFPGHYAGGMKGTLVVQ